LSYICDLRPSCFDLPNVISVAALNGEFLSPNLFIENQKIASNYGSHVHIGAPGDSIFSTIAFGRYGLMSGTSAAAPQVAAVASLMAKRYHGKTPQEIKNRLIYCSDHYDNLEGKLVGGRLNAQCAMDGESSDLRLRTAPDGPSLRGFFQVGALVQFHEVQSGRAITLPISTIRALHFNKMYDTFTIYFNDDQNRTDSLLRKEANMVANVVADASPANDLKFRPASGSPPIPIKLTDIIKYVSSM
jgi:hypothetical protein